MNAFCSRRRCLLSLCAGLLSAGFSSAQDTEPPAEGTVLKAMSFNIRYAASSDGPNLWEHRVEMVADVFKKHAPDIAGLQEALRRQLDDLKPHLEEYAEIGAGRDDGKEKGEYSPILYKSSVLEPLESGTFWLSDTPEVPGSMTWGAKLPRVCTWGHFRHRASGRTFYFYNSHWDHQSVPSREKSAGLMAERIAKRPKADDPVIVTGDFNTDEASDPMQFLTGKKPGSPVVLVDPFRALHPDLPLTESGTFHGWSGKITGPKIDFILTTAGVKAESAEILHDRKGERLPSDHFPVTAVLRLK